MKRPLIALVLVLAAATAQAQSRVNGVPKPPVPMQTDSLGPRSDPTVTVATAVARTQIEKAGYWNVRGVQRAADGTWHATALDSGNTPVAVVLDDQGKVTQAR